MEKTMSTRVRSDQEFTTPLRVIFGLVAIATLLNNTPWTQSDQLAAVTSTTGSLMWGLMAAFGNKAGWPRSLTLFVAIAYLALVLCKVLGFAA